MHKDKSTSAWSLLKHFYKRVLLLQVSRVTVWDHHPCLPYMLCQLYKRDCFKIMCKFTVRGGRVSTLTGVSISLCISKMAKFQDWWVMVKKIWLGQERSYLLLAQNKVEDGECCQATPFHFSSSGANQGRRKRVETRGSLFSSFIKLCDNLCGKPMTSNLFFGPTHDVPGTQKWRSPPPSSPGGSPEMSKAVSFPAWSRSEYNLRDITCWHDFYPTLSCFYLPESFNFHFFTKPPWS